VKPLRRGCRDELLGGDYHFNPEVMAASALRLVLVAAALPALAPAAGAARPVATLAFPAAGELTTLRVVVRAAPDPRARVVDRLSQFRRDYRPQVVLALGTRRSSDGASWYRLSLPGKPNGRRGWVLADDVDLQRIANRITILRGARTLEVRRRSTGRLLLRTPIAVGKPGAETPIGRNFYVQARFFPTDAFYGTLAVETTAYAPLTDWPGDGVVGIHGTNAPQLIGQAVSQGCVRLPNAAAAELRRLAPLGTPMDIPP
jgi:lipoprotein-anchoring transpeptidase ErfK/SrfK